MLVIELDVTISLIWLKKNPYCASLFSINSGLVHTKNVLYMYIQKEPQSIHFVDPKFPSHRSLHSCKCTTYNPLMSCVHCCFVLFFSWLHTLIWVIQKWSIVPDFVYLLSLFHYFSLILVPWVGMLRNLIVSFSSFLTSETQSQDCIGCFIWRTRFSMLLWLPVSLNLPYAAWQGFCQI